MKALVRNPEAVAGLVMNGASAGGAVIVRNKLALAVVVPIALSEIDCGNSPGTVSIGTVPEITPVLVLQSKYSGKPDALYDVATPPAVVIG